MAISDVRSRAHFRIYNLFIYSNGRGAITYVAGGLADTYVRIQLVVSRALFF